MSVYPTGADVERDAVLSPDGRYRYLLTRWWGGMTADDRALTFVMLNPSTADAANDDPTIARCVGFARTHGYHGIAVVNLYAYRATKPTALWAARDEGIDIVGPNNDHVLREIFDLADATNCAVVGAWGAGAPSARADTVRTMAAMHGVPLRHLGLNANGSPKHPLYVKGDTPLTPLETP